jgi:hypothetical protein
VLQHRTAPGRWSGAIEHRERSVRAYSVTGAARVAQRMYPVCLYCAALLPRRARRGRACVRTWWPRRRRRGCERLMQVVSLRVITINETGCKFRDSGTVRSRSCLAASQQLSSIILAVPIRVPRARLRSRVPQWILPDPGSRRRISPVHLRSSSPVLSHRSRLPGRGTAPPRGGPATR